MSQQNTNQSVLALFALALVGILLKGRSPSAVFWRVVAVVVDAVDRVQWTLTVNARRSKTHIRQEVLEEVPSLADADPARAVVFKERMIGVAAAGKHIAPSLILGALFTVASLSVTQVDRGSVFDAPITTIAAARLGSITAQHCTFNDDFVAAIAQAFPPLSVTDCSALYKQSREALSCQID